MENLKRTFGDKLKQERKKLDMRQEDLAKKLGMTTATIRNWEQGRTWPEMPDFIRLCALLDCDADYLAGRIEQKTHDLTFLCSETGLTPQAIQALADIKNGPFGGDNLRIVSEILKSPKLPDLIQSVKDAQWAKDEVASTARTAFDERGDPRNRLIAIEDLPGQVRFLRSFRFEVSEGAASILNEILQIDDTIYMVEARKKILDLDGLKKEAEHEQ